MKKVAKLEISALYEMLSGMSNLGCMKKEPEETNPIQFIRELCKGRTEEEMLEAEQNLREYLMVIKEMCDRIELEENGPGDFDDHTIS